MDMHPFLRKNLSDTVKEKLLEYIENLDLKDGTKLPPETAIAQNYGVSRVTVRRALDELEQEGAILRIHGRGTFVNPLAKQFKINLSVSQELSRVIEQSGYEMRIELRRFDTIPCDLIVGHALELPGSTPIYLVEKAYYAGDQLAILCQDYMSRDIFSTPPDRNDFAQASTYDVLRVKAGKLVVRDWIQLKAVPCPDAGFAHDSVLEIYGVTYGADNRPLLYGRTFYDTDLIRFNLFRNIIAY